MMPDTWGPPSAAEISAAENENARLSKRVKELVAQNTELLKKVEQLQAERDAMIEELKNAYSCFACKKFHRNGGECKAGGVCMMRDFEWRGVQKEE